MIRSLFPTLFLTASLLAAGCAQAQPQKLVWEPLDEPGSGGWTTAIRVSPHDSKRILMGGDMLGVGLSTDGGQSWGATSGFSTWEINDFTFDPKNPQVAWVGTLSGPYQSSDGGKTWVSRRKGFPKQLDFGFSAPVERVLIDPNDPKRLLTFGGSSRGWSLPGPRPLYGAVWESTDGGENWAKIATIGPDGNTDDPTQGVSLYAMSFAAGSSQTLYAGAPQGGFFGSKDGGKTWTKSVAGLPHTNVRRVIAHPGDPKTVWIALSNAKDPAGGPNLPGGIFKSTDGGQNWVSISTGLSQARDKNSNFTARYEGLAVCEANPDAMYTADTAWNTGIIYATKDGGAHWRAVGAKGNLGHPDTDVSKGAPIETAYPAGAAGTFLTVDPKNPDFAFVIGSEHILKTGDGGAKWDDAGSVKVGANWRGRGFSGLASMNFRFDPFVKGQAVLQSMDAGRAWISTDHLKSWNYGAGLSQPSPWGGGKDAGFSKDGTIYISTGQHGQFFGIGRSKDGGKSWQILQGAETGLPAWNTKNEPDGIYTLPNDSQKVWAVVGQKLFFSRDGGQQWADLKVGQKVGWIAGGPKNPLHFYVSGENAVLETSDGQTFKPIGGPPKAGRLTMDALGRLYLAADGVERGGLWRYDATQPENARWARLFDDKWILNVAADPANPNRLALTTNMNPFGELSKASGVWISGDGGQSWSQQNDGLAMLRGHAIAFDPFDGETLIFGSFGRGFWKTKWPKNFVPTDGKTYQTNAQDIAFATGAAPIAAAPVAAAAAPQKDELTFVIRDFGPRGFDYTYGPNWKKGQNIKPDGDGVAIDTNEAGGAGLTLNGANLTPQNQTHLAVRAKLRAGNAAAKLQINFNGPGANKSVTLDLSKFNAESYTTVFVPLPAAKFDNIAQIQVQGTNWGGGQAVKILIDKIGTTSLDETANTAALDKAQEAAKTDPKAGPPAKAKPSVAGWGFYAKFPDAWMNVHQGFLARTKLGQEKKDINVVFLGDSITQGWGGGGKEIWAEKYKPLGAVNYGIGGDSTRQVLWRLQNGEVDGISPKLVVLMIGTNNLYGDFNAGSDEEIAKGIETIVQTLQQKLPNTKILLLGLLPRENAYFSGRVQKINAQISKLDNGKTVRFLDMGPQFATTPGKGDILPELFRADRLHPVTKGYEVWAATMAPLFDEMMR